jgi:peptidoglycan/LPS O-acetylase OafA/YrhL
LIITIIIFVESDLQMQVEWSTLVKQYMQWFVYHGTMINDHGNSQLINAGVDWTLKYEWFFYLLLPIIALVVAKSRYLLMALFILSGLLFVFPTYVSSFSTKYFFFFAIGGMIAYFYASCSKRSGFVSFVGSRYGSVATLLVLLFALFYSETGTMVHVFSVSLFFLLIVLGSSMFGLFRSRASVLLGEISYSIYLLHGIVLYALFSSGNIINLTEISLLQYLYILPVVALLVILFSASTYLEIEKPGIAMGKRVGFDWVKGWLGGKYTGIASA